MGLTRPLFFGLAFIFLLVSCQKELPNGNSGKNSLRHAPDQKMEGFTLQSFGSSGLDWELSAPSGESYSVEGRTHVKNLTLNLFQNSQKSTTINADEGVMYSGADGGAGQKKIKSLYSVQLDPGDFYLKGHVVVISTEGHRLSTEWAHYQKKIDLIVSTAPVQVTRDDSIITGVGMEATPTLSSVKIFNQTLVIKDHEEESSSQK